MRSSERNLRMQYQSGSSYCLQSIRLLTSINGSNNEYLNMYSHSKYKNRIKTNDIKLDIIMAVYQVALSV